MQNGQYTDPGLWWRKVQHLLQVPSKEFRQHALKWCELPQGFQERFLNTEWGTDVVECVTSSWTFFWYVGCEIIRSQYHQPSGSNQSEVYVLVGKLQLTSFIWWGFQTLKHSPKDVAQNIIHRPWGGTKGPWLCQVAKLLLFYFAWLFSFFSCIFSFLWLNLLFGTQERSRRLGFLKTRDRQWTWGVSLPGRPFRVLFGYPSYANFSLINKNT